MSISTKIRRPSLYIFICIVSFIFSACSFPRLPTDYSLRPTTLQVVDAETKIPLQNITVYQILESKIYGGCLSFFIQDCPSRSNYFADYRHTDDNGLVSFQSRKLHLTCNEYIDTEYLIVNLDLDNAGFRELERMFHDSSYPVTKESALIHFGVTPLKDDQRKYLTTINMNYRGYLILGREHGMGPEYWHGKEEKFDVVTNSKGLVQKGQKLIVPLKPHGK